MKRDACKKLAERFFQPAAGECITLRGQHKAEITGCQRILAYSPTRITLLMGRKKLILVGKGMVCSSFSAGSLWIKGRINGVFYPTGEERK